MNTSLTSLRQKQNTTLLEIHFLVLIWSISVYYCFFQNFLISTGDSTSRRMYKYIPGDLHMRWSGSQMVTICYKKTYMQSGSRWGVNIHQQDFKLKNKGRKK